MVSEMREKLAGAGLALYPSVERAVRALAAAVKYWERRA
jgi:acyl-CoA synthetase (NDP forming)